MITGALHAGARIPHPVAADPDIILLNHYDGVDGSTFAEDFSVYNNTMVFVGTGQVSTAQSRYGSGAFYRPNTVGSCSAADLTYSIPRRFGSGNFTVECSMRPDAIGEYQPPLSIVGQVVGGLGEAGYSVLIGENFAEGRISAWFFFDVVSDWKLKLDGPPNSLPRNQWTDVCVERIGDVAYLMVNGIPIASGAITGSVDPDYDTSPAAINLGGGGSQYSGYIDEVRVTRRKAWYPATGYTPTGPFPNQR